MTSVRSCYARRSYNVKSCRASLTDVFSGALSHITGGDIVPVMEKGTALGRLLRTYREEKGWKQADAAMALGIDQSAISNHERGARVPTDEHLAAYAAAYEVEVETLHALRDGREAPAPSTAPVPAAGVQEEPCPDDVVEAMRVMNARLDRIESAIEKLSAEAGDKAFLQSVINQLFSRGFGTPRDSGRPDAASQEAPAPTDTSLVRR